MTADGRVPLKLAPNVLEADEHNALLVLLFLFGLMAWFVRLSLLCYDYFALRHAHDKHLVIRYDEFQFNPLEGAPRMEMPQQEQQRRLQLQDNQADEENISYTALASFDSSDDGDGSHIDSSDDGDCYDLPKGLFLQLLRERKMLHLPLPVLQALPINLIKESLKVYQPAGASLPISPSPEGLSATPIAQTHFILQFRVECSYPCSLQLFWGVPTREVDQLFSIAEEDVDEEDLSHNLLNNEYEQEDEDDDMPLETMRQKRQGYQTDIENQPDHEGSGKEPEENGNGEESDTRSEAEKMDIHQVSEQNKEKESGGRSENSRRRYRVELHKIEMTSVSPGENGCHVTLFNENDHPRIQPHIHAGDFEDCRLFRHISYGHKSSKVFEEGHLYTSEPIPLHSFIPSSLFESMQTEQQISEIISELDGDSFNTSADLSAPSYALIIVLQSFAGQSNDIHQYRPSGKHQGSSRGQFSQYTFVQFIKNEMPLPKNDTSGGDSFKREKGKEKLLEDEEDGDGKAKEDLIQEEEEKRDERTGQEQIGSDEKKTDEAKEERRCCVRLEPLVVKQFLSEQQQQEDDYYDNNDDEEEDEEDEVQYEAKEIFGLLKGDSKECVVCLTDEAADTTLLPCRHTSVCYHCLKQIEKKECPMCRTPFTWFLRWSTTTTTTTT